MRNGGNKKKHVSPIYTIGIIFLLVTVLTNGGIFAAGALAALGYFIVKRILGAKDKEAEAQAEERARQAQRTAADARAAQASTQTSRRSDSDTTAQSASRTEAIPKQYREAEQARPVTPPKPAKPKYPEPVQQVVDAGEKAHDELTRLYATIPDLAVKRKIQEIIDISDKIVADAVADPSDVPQIKKFLDYYLPTTIKLLNSYERMSAQGIEGKNISKTKDSINEMLDTAIDAYKKLLDSLFADQAMDVETDIQVMNTLLKREGFAGGRAFQME